MADSPHQSPDPTPDPAAARKDAARQRARDLVRRRTGDYRAPETGRHHHIGAAPERQPLLSGEGPSYVETASVQLAQRTVAQLVAQRDRHASRMRAAAEELDFERAGRERDALQAVDDELARRGAAQRRPADRPGPSDETG